MTALDRAFDISAGGVTALLQAADRAHTKLEDAQFTASFAPPITSFGTCPCGATYEVRDNQIKLTEDEIAAAVDRLADRSGRAPLDDLDRATVISVIDVINHERASADWDAQHDWDATHEFCGDDL